MWSDRPGPGQYDWRGQGPDLVTERHRDGRCRMGGASLPGAAVIVKAQRGHNPAPAPAGTLARTGSRSSTRRTDEQPRRGPAAHPGPPPSASPPRASLGTAALAVTVAVQASAGATADRPTAVRPTTARRTRAAPASPRRTAASPTAARAQRRRTSGGRTTASPARHRDHRHPPARPLRRFAMTRPGSSGLAGGPGTAEWSLWSTDRPDRGDPPADPGRRPRPGERVPGRGRAGRAAGSDRTPS